MISHRIYIIILGHEMIQESKCCGSNRNGFFTAGMKRSVLNASELRDGCFTAAFFQTHHASFSVRCGGRTAVGGGNGHEGTYLLARTSGETTARPPVFVCRTKQVHTSWI